ncbi:FAD-binding oxidoreductase [Promicromonospora sp. NFX87]|uniref:FAD-binding oxidoreductase n=1 Tax=Promicromonospora sp. NFX87 TaxID=3402691 RepID=UPI003AFB3C63
MLLDLYTVTVLGIYFWKKWIAPDGYLAGTVVSNEARGRSTRRILVGLDATAVNVRPGDFFFLQFEDSAAVSREWHPFSVTDDDRDTLSFTVRQRGDFTRRVGGVREGPRVRLEGPFGRFESIVRKHDEDAPLVLIGMGAGVAPLLSLMAGHHTRRRIHVLWAVRRPEDAYYRDVLAQYQLASGRRMQVTIKVGRFRRQYLDGLLPTPVLRTGAFFVVGPNPAVLATQRLLRQMGVPARRIHQERLTM